jgi:hypothetical protein
MSDTTTTDTTTADQTDTTSTDTADDTKDWAAEANKWKEMARKHEERAKTNSTAAKELEQLRKQSMNDQEKAVAAAKEEGRNEGLAVGAAKVVKAEIKAAAAGRMTADQIDALLRATNLAVFIGDDGEVDEAEVARFVDGIAPKRDDTDDGKDTRHGFPDLGQGARGGANAALNGDPLLRDLKAKLGIR